MRLRQRLLAVLAAGLTALPGVAVHEAPAQAIANGETAADGQYPFSVKLTMTGLPDGNGGRRNSSCSGGLVAPRWVLTAGHCFQDGQLRRVAKPVARKTTATVGRADLTNSTEGQVASVVAVRQSPVTDVALAKLDKDITGIDPMRLSRSKPKVGQTVRLTGFGLLDGADKETAEQMQIGDFTVSVVQQYLIGVSGKSPGPDTSACKHDSGGPYFKTDAKGVATVVAVVSGGPTCPHEGPDTSGRIDTIVPWILAAIGTDGPRPSSPPPPPPSALAKKGGPSGSQPVAAPAPDRLLGVEVPTLNEAAPYALAGTGAVVVLIIIVATARGRRKRRRFRHRRP